jgi:hypothetical protein
MNQLKKSIDKLKIGDSVFFKTYGKNAASGINCMVTEICRNFEMIPKVTNVVVLDSKKEPYKVETQYITKVIFRK